MWSRELPYRGLYRKTGNLLLCLLALPFQRTHRYRSCLQPRCWSHLKYLWWHLKQKFHEFTLKIESFILVIQGSREQEGYRVQWVRTKVISPKPRNYHLFYTLIHIYIQACLHREKNSLLSRALEINMFILLIEKNHRIGKVTYRISSICNQLMKGEKFL